jgi:uncharacterized protein YdbL (DUF1318 family)
VKRSLFLFLAAVAIAAPAAAQSRAVTSALAQGQIGERFDGYMGFVINPSAEVRRQVAAINLRRRNLYIGLASRRNVSSDVVGLATGCQLFASLAVGQAYMLRDGVWRRRAAGQPAPVPAYCG